MGRRKVGGWRIEPLMSVVLSAVLRVALIVFSAQCSPIPEVLFSPRPRPPCQEDTVSARITRV